jgi:hypothetical protein
MRTADPRLLKRRHSGSNTDPGEIANNSYSEPAGATKISDVGHKLAPIQDPATTNGYTTDASSRRKIGQGCSMAFYATAAGSVTFGDSTVTSLAAGVTDAGKLGFVGIPLAIGWTYLNSWQHDWMITSAGILSFVVEDATYASLQK